MASSERPTRNTAPVAAEMRRLIEERIRRVRRRAGQGRMTRHDRRVIRRAVLEHNLRAWSFRQWWNSLSAWTQIYVGAGVVCAVELLVIWAIYPYLLEAVAA
jgi:hypothetical protein